MSGTDVGMPVFGWDVGGAHLKVSKVDRTGALIDVAQWPCRLWQGLDQLHQSIDAVLDRWPDARSAGASHAVTMTGEMVDLFADRADGVRAIANALASKLHGRLMFFGGGRWFDASACAAAWHEIASANWLATASWVASCVHDALLIDIGSTTTDIIPIVRGWVAAIGGNDADRLIHGELVYQGVVRTPLCGVAHRIVFRNRTTNVMNEWFATTADVYRLTGELWPPHDQHPSADNGPKTMAASCARLARMIGRDAADASEVEWRNFARHWRAVQLDTLYMNLARVRHAHPSLVGAPLVAAGCGRFLVTHLAQHDRCAMIDISSLGEMSLCGEETLADPQCAEWIATCAPAVAVAMLAAHTPRAHLYRAA
ncbi:hydantoinase/oxoprolinase family protein [Paraburkholderia sp.]|uniref:hydantoinase/oxoprolinase family protein n=1 Tax=Paraburkholderia sp. TaxID=1926495 RepID=UPI00238379EB|nr:hydantoinase/oxoprolinase family protein [Paraburkholderia sp.]MDE1179170.1 hydantoinase/oxoprolinase family protein [Paraburkholderia sp.]